jgi:hypothetical protein
MDSSHITTDQASEDQGRNWTGVWLSVAAGAAYGASRVPARRSTLSAGDRGSGAHAASMDHIALHVDQAWRRVPTENRGDQPTPPRPRRDKLAGLRR